MGERRQMVSEACGIECGEKVQKLGGLEGDLGPDMSHQMLHLGAEPTRGALHSTWRWYDKEPRGMRAVDGIEVREWGAAEANIDARVYPCCAEYTYKRPCSSRGIVLSMQYADACNNIQQQ